MKLVTAVVLVVLLLVLPMNAFAGSPEAGLPQGCKIVKELAGGKDERRCKIVKTKAFQSKAISSWFATSAERQIEACAPGKVVSAEKSYRVRPVTLRIKNSGQTTGGWQVGGFLVVTCSK